MRIKEFLIVFVLVFLQFSYSQNLDQRRLNIAVSDLIGRGIDQESADIICDRLRTELFRTGVFTVLERQEMRNILKEQGFQQSGACTDEACLVQMGQLLGVTHMVSGAVGKLGDIFTINVRLIDVATGKIVFTESVDCECPVGKILTTSTPEVARKIASAVSASLPALTSMSAPVSSPIPQSSPPSLNGSLSIKSIPSGAILSLGDSAVGTTPFSSSAINVGEYRLRLESSGYDPITGMISVKSGALTERSFSMRHSRQWGDSVKIAERNAKAASAAKNAAPVQAKGKKHHLAPKIVLGTLTGGSAIVGAVFNEMAKSKLKDIATLKDEFAVKSGNAEFAVYQSSIDAKSREVEKNILRRNLSYGIAGLFAVGFGVSFAF